MKKLLLLSAGFVLAAHGAFAAITADQLVSAYQAEGFNAIEVTTGVSQIKVEAIKNGAKVEVIYDLSTGAILKQEQRRARAKDSNDTSVQLASSTDDFTQGGTHDVNDDHGAGNDDGLGHDVNDDHGGGNDDGAGHDVNDDHGAGNDDGSTHDQGDDNGSASGNDDDDHSGNSGSGNSHDDNSGSDHDGSDHDGSNHGGGENGGGDHDDGDSSGSDHD